MIFKRQAQEEFKVDPVSSPEMDALIERCANIYRGRPDWISDPDDHIKTINFAKSICSETARLTMLAAGIQISGSARATWLQEQVDKVYFNIREWVEYGCAYGTIIIKPNGMSFDVFTPNDFMIIDCDNLGINGIVFFDHYEENKKYYTRLEYHRFVETKGDEGTHYPYYISNKAYVSKSANAKGDPIPLAQTKWADLMEETPPILKQNGEKLDGPMFGVFSMPGANNIDISTPMGLPIFTDAIEEFHDLDVAYSRNSGEIFDSEKIILLDADRLVPTGTKISETTSGFEARRKQMKLPHYIRNVFGDGQADFYHEIVPSLNTDVRLAGINALLSQIGYKCGYSNGYFVFNEKTNMATATQVESDDRRTIQLIKDVRDKLESCLDGAIYAMSVYADLYRIAPVGAYEIVYDFGDITYNREEDRARWWNYVVQGKVPAWMYFVKWEGMTEEDAKAMVEEAKPKEEPGWFGQEE